MKALVDAFNKEKALVGAFSVIVKTGCGTNGALHSTKQNGIIHRQVDRERWWETSIKDAFHHVRLTAL